MFDLIYQWFEEYIWTAKYPNTYTLWVPGIQNGTLGTYTIDTADLFPTLNLISSIVFMCVLLVVGWKLIKWIFGQFGELNR